MSLLRLDITHFRNLASVKIDLTASGFHFFYGCNASGKTSLLEAIYYLSRGRSFRSSSVGHIINHLAPKFSLFAQIQTNDQQVVPVGVERQRDGTMRVRVAARDKSSIGELLELAPLLLINSNSFNLLDAGPVFRRKYLDWSAFYLAPDFLPVWKTYERVLKQRNTALRERRPSKELEIWSAELIKSATSLDAIRRNVIAQLLPFLQSTLLELIDIPGLELAYYPGWDDSLTYQDAMARWGDRDVYAGHTQLGPHRADFKISINQIPVKDILSRGQQKLFICAMIIGQGAMLHEYANRKPIYLMDDLPSELDHHSRSRLMRLLEKQTAQVFVTAVEREAWVDSCQTPIKMFHVEHNDVREENWEQ